MMVTFISQCEKKSLQKTRRVLDAFANRIGDRTWQTVITEEGLNAVKKLLKKTASKNTAVSCHWIRSRSRSELLWVVGKRSAFNSEGYIPVNTTKESIHYVDNQEDWFYLPVIRAITSLAALLHDWGKANIQFQKKLSKEKNVPYSDALRHEWVTCLLLNSLVKSSTDTKTDEGWLKLLSNGEIDETILAQNDLTQIKTPLQDVPPLAQIISYLIISHHKMPLIKIDSENRYSDFKESSSAESFNELFSYLAENWGYKNEKSLESLDDCISFYPDPLRLSNEWIKNIKRWSKKLLTLNDQIESLIKNNGIRLIIFLCRISLMLADHNYSSLSKEETKGWKSSIQLIANTNKDGTTKQTLDQHLVGVHQQAKEIVNLLPEIEKILPTTDNTSIIKQTSPEKFKWQDKAARKISDWTATNSDNKCGFFAVNIASTGSGKTFANAKIMLALSENNQDLRFTLALGLRTLTLQTGEEYKQRIFQNSDKSDLAVIVGSKEIIKLYNQEIDKTRDTGSESIMPLLDDEIIYYEEEFYSDYFPTILKDEKSKKLLYAPILTCTIDHIMPATEITRGGRFILPALRLMTSDLVIDEIDDFTSSDSIAIGRLIHLAGMLGRKVMISSATIPPSLAEGYFNCYKEGWKIFSKTRNATDLIGCAWIDEFNTYVENIDVKDHTKSINYYESKHSFFLQKRISELKKLPPKRKAIIVKYPNESISKESDNRTKMNKYFTIIINAALEKHLLNNNIDKKTKLKVSFGVIRTANISPCVELTKFLLNYEQPKNLEIRVMAYHSQQTLLLRNEQEKHLDCVLKRKEKFNEEPVAFSNEIIRRHLDLIKTTKPLVEDVLFILVATPIEEVGRDHDLDWAIIEPSSYRSIVQLAGRIRRHRDEPTNSINIGILQYNWKTFRDGKENNSNNYFSRPGYETGEILIINNRKIKAVLSTHDLTQLIDENEIKKNLNLIPRITTSISDNFRLAKLEHAVTANWLSQYGKKGPDSLQGYLTHYWYLTALPQAIHPFRKETPDIRLFRCFDRDKQGYFTEKDIKGKAEFTSYEELVNRDYLYRIEEEDFNNDQQNRLWLIRDYYSTLNFQSQLDDISLDEGALRFGEITIPRPNEGNETPYFYNDQLGLYRKIQ